MLRSILWGVKGNLRWATRVSSAIGSAFGIGLIVLGIFQFIYGNIIGGLWMFLIGMFLKSAAQMSYQQLLVRKALEGEKVSRFMNTNPVTVQDSITVEQLVEDYIYKHHYKMFPVMSGDKLAGCITTRQVKEIPREAWNRETIREAASQCSPENTISPDTDAIKALAMMTQSGVSRLAGGAETGVWWGSSPLKTCWISSPSRWSWKSKTESSHRLPNAAHEPEQPDQRVPLPAPGHSDRGPGRGGDSRVSWPSSKWGSGGSGPGTAISWPGCWPRPWWLRILIPTLGGLAVGPVIAFYAPEARGPGVPEVIESAALREGHILPSKAVLKAWVTSLTIATGGSVGREGPVVGLGAAIGSAMTRLFSFSAGKGRICLACGVAAGFAATFNTPISGALFTIEVILADMEIVYLGHIVIAAIVAVLIARQFFGDFPTFQVARLYFS